MNQPQREKKNIKIYRKEMLKLLLPNTDLKQQQLSQEQLLLTSIDLDLIAISTAIKKNDLQTIVVIMMQQLTSTCRELLNSQKLSDEQFQLFFSSKLLRNIKKISRLLSLIKSDVVAEQHFLDTVNQTIIASLLQILFLYSKETPKKYTVFSKKLEETVKLFTKKNQKSESLFKVTQLCIDSYIERGKYWESNITQTKRKIEFYNGIRSLIQKIVQQTHTMCQRQEEEETIYVIYKKLLALLIQKNTNINIQPNEILNLNPFLYLFENNQVQTCPNYQQILQKMQSQGKLCFSNFSNTENNIYQPIQVYELLKQWIDDHQQIFRNPEKYMFSKNNFQTISNRTNSSLQMGDKLKIIQNIKQLSPQVKQHLQNLKQEYTLFQKYFFHFQTPNNQTLLIKDRNLRSFSSTISKIMIHSFTERHLQILIHYLLMAGSNLDKPTHQSINLLNFTTKNLLKSEIICNENTIINILNTLYKFHHQDFTIENVQISTIRNIPVVNVVCILFKRFKAIYQFFTQKNNNKFKRSDSILSKLIWKLKGNPLGPLAELSLMYCRNDPLTYKLLKSQASQIRKEITLKDGIQFLQPSDCYFQNIFVKNGNVFICSNCKILKINQKQMYKGYPSCTECILQKENLLQNKLKEIQNFFKSKCRRITKMQQFKDSQIIFVHRIKYQYLRQQSKLKIYRVKYFQGQSDLLLFQLHSIKYYQQQKPIQYFQLSNLYKTWKNGEIIYSIQQFKLQQINDQLSSFMEQYQSIKFNCIDSDNKTAASMEEIQKRSFHLEQHQIVNLSDQKEKFEDWFNLIKKGKFKLPHEIHLSNLDLKNDPFQDTKIKANADYTKLKILDLSDNKLTSIELKHFPNLVSADISFNEISNTLDLLSLTQLEVLVACENKLKKIRFPHPRKPSNNKPQYQLKTVNLSYNRFKDQPRQQQRNQVIIIPPSIQKLDLSNNSLQKIDISKAENLYYLDLSFNKLLSITLSLNKHLQILHLEVNNLKTIDITQNLQLKEIFVYENMLTSEIVLNEHKQLEKVYIGKNNIKQINLDFKLCYLKEMSLSEITIKDITLNYQHLQYFELSNSGLITITLQHNPKLSKMLLQSNELEEVNLQTCHQLRLLDLTNNKLAKLDLSNNKLLEDIMLYDNQLTLLLLPQSDKLKSLDTRENCLTQLTIYVTAALLADNIFLDASRKQTNQRISGVISSLKQNQIKKYQAIVFDLRKEKLSKPEEQKQAQYSLQSDSSYSTNSSAIKSDSTSMSNNKQFNPFQKKKNIEQRYIQQ